MTQENKNLYQKEVVANLTPLITELIQLDEWPDFDLDGVLLLYDLCKHLKLPIATICNMLGVEATRYLLELGVLERKQVQRASCPMVYP